MAHNCEVYVLIKFAMRLQYLEKSVENFLITKMATAIS